MKSGGPLSGRRFSLSRARRPSLNRTRSSRSAEHDALQWDPNAARTKSRPTSHFIVDGPASVRYYFDLTQRKAGPDDHDPANRAGMDGPNLRKALSRTGRPATGGGIQVRPRARSSHSHGRNGGHPA